MNVLICNERLLFRFGLDRVLLLIAREFAARGDDVTLIANRFDPEVTRSIGRAVEAPVPADYLSIEEHTAQWLDETWDSHFADSRSPDVVIVGGWPFLSSIDVFRSRGIPVVFIDCGAVPLTGMTGGALVVQTKLRSLRDRFIRRASRVIAISEFIARSQSLADAKGLAPVESILLGGDHLAESMWSSETISASSGDGIATDLVSDAKARGQKVVLNLGRWEPGCYKNSEAAFDVLRALLAEGHDAVLAVLEVADVLKVPTDLAGRVLPIGFPDDRQLESIKSACDAGISVSTWEGFNLPIAEMQWLDKPVLALDLAAHPEVISHPWFLCESVDEMAVRAGELLRDGGPDADERVRARQRFRDDFAWSRVASRYVDSIRSAASSATQLVVVDVTNASRDDANSGVIRVTRRLCAELRANVAVLFVVWLEDRKRYALPTPDEYRRIGSFNGPTTDHLPYSTASRRVLLDEELERRAVTGPKWLLLTETVMEERGAHIRRLAKHLDLSLAAIFYDAIPVLRPELVADDAIRTNHARYMRGLASCDAVLPISEFSGQCLEEFWTRAGMEGARVAPCLLPGEFGGTARTRRRKALPSAEPIHVLCVSTLEPRKNHGVLLEAFELATRRRPDLDIRLSLIGNRYAGAESISLVVRAASLANPRIEWLGVVDDRTLGELYAHSTVTVYASTIEGFGMPILESLWSGTPCLCHDSGVMRELAADGGCVTVDMTDAVALADELIRTVTSRARYSRLVDEAVRRPMKSWNEYGREILAQLGILPKASPTEKAAPAPSYEDVLYRDCLTTEWQMNDSERLGLMAVLHRIQPRVAIEIGTYRGGSLSLISQFAETVYSIDIDPSIPAKYSQFENVRFLTGPSSEVLPALLRELDGKGLAVEFVLIDGDHSADGIRRDIEILLDYQPRAPLFIMMHDGFNPECRRGMTSANWERSPHVRWVDVDFIPGRVIEHGGGGNGEMWGGLGAALLTPEPRDADLRISASASSMYETLRQKSYGGPSGDTAR